MFETYNHSLDLQICIEDLLETTPLLRLRCINKPKKETRSIGLMNAIVHLGLSRNA